jgi:hypothetical protein
VERKSGKRRREKERGDKKERGREREIERERKRETEREKERERERKRVSDTAHMLSVPSSIFKGRDSPNCIVSFYITAFSVPGKSWFFYAKFSLALLTLMNKGEREVKRKKREEREGETEGETKREGWGQRERGLFGCSGLAVWVCRVGERDRERERESKEREGEIV